MDLSAISDADLSRMAAEAWCEAMREQKARATDG